MKNSLLLVVFIAFVSHVKAQQAKIQALSIGQACPDLVLTDIINYARSSVKISDFKGKMIILDFFTTGCVPCVKSLPKLDAIQRKFADQLQVIMVCVEEKADVSDFLNKAEKLHGIQIPFATKDTLLYQYFRHNYVPFNVIIGADGIVKAMPPPSYINEENVSALIKGKDLNLPVVKFDNLTRNHLNGALLVSPEANDAGKILYHSILTGYLENMSSTSLAWQYKDTSISARILMYNMPLLLLYQEAYGHFNKEGRSSFITWNRIVVETKDSAIIECLHSDDWSSWARAHSFCYDLILPNSYKGDAHEIMQADLKKVFDYDVRMENKKVKCLVFKKGKDGDKLISKGGKENLDMNPEYLKMKNASWKEMMFWFENKYSGSKLPFIDETGYDRVDLDINADLTKPEELATVLKPLGIDVVVEERYVEKLVIGDRKDSGQ